MHATPTLEIESLPEEDSKIARVVERAPNARSVFSAYEVGRATIPRERLQLETGYDYSLPHEQDSPADIYDLYHRHPNLDFLPVRDGSGWITGYLTRRMFLASLSESQFSRDLLFRKEASIQGLINRQVVCLNAGTTLSEASEILMQRPDRMRFDPFVVTLDRHFYGISTVDRVIRGINYFLSKDLDAVRNAQMSLIKAGGQCENLTVALEHHHHIAPLNGPGGDFVKVYEFNNQYTLAMLFDVCGKGVRAASMVSVLGSLFYTMWKSLHWSGMVNLRVMENELYRANNDLTRLTAEEMYASGIVVLFDKQNFIVSLFDYGHGMIWLRRNRRVHPIAASAPEIRMPFFGINENVRVPPFSYRVKSGDILLVCSDGITEQMNHEREMYEAERLKNSLAVAPTSTLNEMSQHILDDWEDFRGTARVRDDVSLLLLRIP